MAGTLNFFQKITHPKVKRENVKNLWKNPCNIRDQSSMTLWNLPLLLLMFRFVCVCVFLCHWSGIFWGGTKQFHVKRIQTAGGVVQTSVEACIFIKKANQSLSLDSYETDFSKTACSMLLCFKRFFEIVFWVLRPTFGTLWSFFGFERKLESGPKNKKNGSLRICLIRIARRLVCSHGLRHGILDETKKSASKVSKGIVVAKNIFFCWHVLTVDTNVHERKVRTFWFFMLGERKLDHIPLLLLERQMSSSFCLTCPQRYYWRASHSSLASWTGFVL